jgi:hypothetical protein
MTEFVERWEPLRFSGQELRHVFARLSLEMEGVAECGDAFTVREARRFIRQLWSVFPWLGFYLAHQRPFGSAVTLGRLPFLAIGLCLTDMTVVANDHTGRCEVMLDHQQLKVFQTQLLFCTDHLARHSRLSAHLASARTEEIQRQIGFLLIKSRPASRR